jgi:N-acetylglucosaminyldiphosphoundecaprenol N-acetyl-beta-D-mannosaminyltransferase
VEGNIAKIDLKTSEILGTRIHVINKIQIINYFRILLNSKEQIALINYVNAHGLLLAHKSTDFQNILNKSTILFCDGFGVKVAAKVLKKNLGDRMTPPDWFENLLELLIQQDKKVYFVGDEQEIITKFVIRVKSDFPDLNITGFHNGFFDHSGEENSNLVEEINKSATDIIITGMGMPVQEMWAYNNREKLNVSVVFSTGALFRHYLGVDKRGPKIFNNYGGEWLMRLLFQPKKLWRRYLIGLPHLFILVLIEALRKR